MKLRKEDQVGHKNWRVVDLEVAQTEPPGELWAERKHLAGVGGEARE